MHSVIVVNRKAYGTSGSVSRSLSARILENLEYLALNNQLLIKKMNENESQCSFRAGEIVIFARHTSPESLELAQAAKSKGALVIYDLDDFMPSLPSYVHHSSDSTVQKNIADHIRNASVVTTSTHTLKKHIDLHYGVSAQVLPTGINIERHQLEGIKRKDLTHSFVYTNTDTIKLKNFKSDFVKTINHYLTSHAEITIDLVCDPNPEMAQFTHAKNHGTMDWFEHKKFLAERDYLFSITPLGGAEDPQDLLFNSCKSPVKFLDYGGSHIPGIYSKSPVYEAFVENLQTGILVSNDREAWSEALELITRDRTLRDKIAKNAFQEINSKFHTRITSQAWLQLLGRL